MSFIYMKTTFDNDHIQNKDAAFDAMYMMYNNELSFLADGSFIKKLFSAW